MDVSEYRDLLEEGVNDARAIATDARSDRFDPKPYVEMEFAANIAERCEKLLMIEGLTERIQALEEQGLSREEIAIGIADEFAEGNIGDYESKEAMIDAAIRTAVALLTEGVVAAPIDGIGEVTIDTNDDGSDFIRIPYYGPIRSAGGTGQALSILVADYIRQKLDISAFQPRDDEIERYVEELHVYDRELSLQYMPPDDEIRHIIKHCSVMIDGVPDTNGEVEGFRDLERIEGNRARGGMCLVVGEGVAQKAPKIQKYTDEMEIEGWEWLEPVIAGELKDSHGADESDDADAEPEATDAEADEMAADAKASKASKPANYKSLKPKTKFIADLIAGRPVFSGPSRKGGFRLRYGRARNLGLAACGYSPATMTIFDSFIATGTQLKTERPGKAAGVAPVDSIEGPTVRLANGEMRRIDDVEEAERLLNAVEEIIDVGEVAVPYGEFLENNHPLPPASYVHEWWIQEFARAGGDASDPAVRAETITPERAFTISEEYDIPLHPTWTYLWDDIDQETYETLSAAVERAHDANTTCLDASHRTIVEDLLVHHTLDAEQQQLVFDEDEWTVLRRCCRTTAQGETVREAVMDAAGVPVRERAPVRIGARMGRPEKSKRRETKPHALFPIGDAGGNQRDIEAAAAYQENADQKLVPDRDRHRGPRKRGEAREDERNEEGLIYTTLAYRNCSDCERETWLPRCPDCGAETEKLYQCPSCGRSGSEGEDCRCNGKPFLAYGRQPLSVKAALASAYEMLGERPTSFAQLKGMKGLTSKSRVPEPLEKGMLRAKYDIRVFRDGTARYDMMDMPLTSFCANDINADVETLHDLGYSETIDGLPLEEPDQLVELFPQDIILADGCGEYMLKVAQFVDELLVQYYDEAPFYNAEDPDDLIGELILGLAPHTSAGVLGRIVGFTPASANFASPFFHAGKRRNCFHPATQITLNDGTGLTTSSLKTFVEQHLDAPETDTTVDDFGTEFLALDTPEHVWSAIDTGEPVFRRVTHVSRTPAPDHLIRITTIQGSELTVTPNHSVLVFEGDADTDATDDEQPLRRLVKKPAFQVAADDTVARPSSPITAVMGVRAGDAAYDEEPFGTVEPEQIANVEIVGSDEAECEYVYNLTVEGTHTVVANELAVAQCDGDEDCVMMLMDGLLNFSKEHLPDRRGQRTMDAPLVVSTVVDPLEVDDEAHNVDIVDHYPIEFYEATYDIPGPKEVDIAIAEDITDDGMGFQHTLETSDIAAGPKQSAYKSIEGMDEKTFAQLNLARKTHAVNEHEIAEMVIEKHFMPDIIGNLSAFARQSVRCPKCNDKYRRVPLESRCKACRNPNIILTVHEGSVKKYIGLVTDISQEFAVTEYTRQRIEALTERADSLFEDDQNKQTDLGSFF